MDYTTRGANRNVQFDSYLRSQIGAQNTFVTTLSTRANLMKQVGVGYTPKSATLISLSGTMQELSIPIDNNINLPALATSVANPKGIIIAIHGYEQSPEIVLGGNDPINKNFGGALVNSGFTVIAPQIVCSAPNGMWDRNRLDRLARLSYQNLMGLELLGLMRLVDGLVGYNLPIHVCGISQGGRTSMHLGALDGRISSVACCSWFIDRQYKMLGNFGLSYINATEDDKFYGDPLYPDWLLGALISSRPLLISTGINDASLPYTYVQSEYNKVNVFYQQNGGSNKAQFYLGSGGHEIYLDSLITFFNT